MKGRPGYIKCKMKAVIGKERLKKNRKKRRKRKSKHLTEQRSKTEHKWNKISPKQEE